DGKTLKTIFADGTFTLSAYDSNGRQTSVTDQMGLTTQYQYDTAGRLIGVTLPAVFDPQSGRTVNPTTSYSYDIYGDMTQIKDALGRITSFTFDQFGHQLTHTLPAIQPPPALPPSESETYDSFGRLSTATDFANNHTVYAYDTLGRVQSKTLSGSYGTETISYHFDSLGRNDTVTDVTNGNT